MPASSSSVTAVHRGHGTFGNEVYAVYLPTRYLSPQIGAFVDFFVVIGRSAIRSSRYPE
jgi:hypothetical protein